MHRILENLYKRIRYGIRTTTVDIVSTLVKCQDVMTLDIYDCSECDFQQVCFQDNSETFFRYLKRNDLYKQGQVAGLSVLDVE